jgi:hypothetical protein
VRLPRFLQGRYLRQDAIIVALNTLEFDADLGFGAIKVSVMGGLASRRVGGRRSKPGGLLIEVLKDFPQRSIGNDGRQRFAPLQAKPSYWMRSDSLLCPRACHARAFAGRQEPFLIRWKA